MHYDDSAKRETREAHEGIFDAQLSLPGHAPRPTTPLDVIIKNDGREERFDKSKIARAIQQAGAAEGGYDEDRAANLASAVAIYLAKHLDRRPATVEDVHTAVERVLMKMGHYKTATAFVRFRERRARLRALRAHTAPPPSMRGDADPAPDSALQIRTSAEMLEAWDRRRIVTALVRETGIPEETAVRVAEDVEQQIVAVNVGTLTTALVRELVTARLIDLGLEQFARRHRRLGVPLYDTETILCGPSPAHMLHTLDPEATDWMLAESVKKEYALSQVFSSDVAEAHALGDIHIHGLAMVDRLFSARHSLELVKRFGMDILGAGTLVGPPRALDVLSAELAGVTMALQRHFCGPLAWRAANVFFAPFLERLSDAELHAWAEMTLRDLAMSAAVSGRAMPPLALELCWDAPPALAAVEAVGPGGAYTGRAYREYDYTTQRAATAFVNAFCGLRRRGVAIASPAPLVRISQAMLRDPGYEAILGHIAALAAAYPGTEVAFDRSDPVLVHDEMPWRSRELCLHHVTINLPRAVYRGGRDGIADELGRIMPIVAAAHAQKYRLIARILEQGEAGPLALIARRREGACIHEVEHAVLHVGVIGLNECVRHCTGYQLHESETAVTFGEEILESLRAQCDAWGEQAGLTFLATATTDTAVAKRLAGIDANHFPTHTMAVIDPGDQDIQYTPGAETVSTAAITPGERVRCESGMHTRLHARPAVRIAIPDTDTSPESIAAFLLKTYRQTNVQRVRFE